MEPGLSSGAPQGSGGCLADSYFLEPHIISVPLVTYSLICLPVPLVTYLYISVPVVLVGRALFAEGIAQLPP